MHQGSQGTRHIDREAMQAERIIVLLGENNTSLWSDPRKCRRQNQLSAVEALSCSTGAERKGIAEEPVSAWHIKAALRPRCFAVPSGGWGDVPRVQPPCMKELS